MMRHKVLASQPFVKILVHAKVICCALSLQRCWILMDTIFVSLHPTKMLPRLQGYLFPVQPLLGTVTGAADRPPIQLFSSKLSTTKNRCARRLGLRRNDKPAEITETSGDVFSSGMTHLALPPVDRTPDADGPPTGTARYTLATT